MSKLRTKLIMDIVVEEAALRSKGAAPGLVVAAAVGTTDTGVSANTWGS